MKKNEYQIPAMEAVKLNYKNNLLAGSGTEIGGGGYDPGDDD